MADKSLYNPHDGLTGRDGGPYLDQEEARLAEIVRARVEKREPDFDHLPATAGTPLVTGKELLVKVNPASNPSQHKADPITVAVETLAADDKYPVNVHSKRPETAAEAAAKPSGKVDIFSNPANSTVVSTDKKKK